MANVVGKRPVRKQSKVEAIHRLKEAQESLSAAIQSIEDAVRLGPRIRGLAESYTIPWIKAFNEDENQTGNIQELIDILSEE